MLTVTVKGQATLESGKSGLSSGNRETPSQTNIADLASRYEGRPDTMT